MNIYEYELFIRQGGMDNVPGDTIGKEKCTVGGLEIETCITVSGPPLHKDTVL
jgi:hypothetical protein